jgi:hypothetical protein
MHLIALTLTDDDFFNLFDNGIPVYQGNRMVYNDYAFAFLDGPHDTKSILRQVEFLAPRMPKGGNIVIDNIDFFDLDYILRMARATYTEVERNIQKIALCRL